MPMSATDFAIRPARAGEAPSGVVRNRMLPLFEFPITRRSAAD
jgi:hypothetical protein